MKLLGLLLEGLLLFWAQKDELIVTDGSCPMLLKTVEAMEREELRHVVPVNLQEKPIKREAEANDMFLAMKDEPSLFCSLSLHGLGMDPEMNKD